MVEERIFRRKLAHIESIESIEPIIGADYICKCKVLGWEICAKKDLYEVGQMIVFFELDSLLNVTDPRFEFLKDTNGRVKIRKFKKQISSGLILPLSILSPKKRNVGDDVTEELGVTHYDPESNLHASNKPYVPKNKFIKFLLRFAFFRKLILPKKEIGAWPVGITKTDEERVQNCKYGTILEETKGKPFYVTIKLDGQSGTYFIKKGKGFFGKPYFGVCSRNVWKKREDNSNHWTVAKKYNIQKKLTKAYQELGCQIVIQGEICGPAIQKNPDNFPDLRFFIFNVKRKQGETYYQYDLNEMKGFCEKYGFDMVPVLSSHFFLPEDPKDLLKLADGKSTFNPKQDREGLVFRLVENGEKKVSFKAISNQFLLKQE